MPSKVKYHSRRLSTTTYQSAFSHFSTTLWYWLTGKIGKPNDVVNIRKSWHDKLHADQKRKMPTSVDIINGVTKIGGCRCSLRRMIWSRHMCLFSNHPNEVCWERSMTFRFFFHFDEIIFFIYAIFLTRSRSGHSHWCHLCVRWSFIIALTRPYAHRMAKSNAIPLIAHLIALCYIR